MIAKNFDPAAFVDLAARRGISVGLMPDESEPSGHRLNVRGDAGAIAPLKPHFVANRAEILKHLQGQGDAQQARLQAALPRGDAQPTPLDILAVHLPKSPQRGNAAFVAQAIDLALWLTQAVANLKSDPSPGFLLPAKSPPVEIARAVEHLARGPTATAAESVAAWIERVGKFRELMDGPTAWRAAV